MKINLIRKNPMTVQEMAKANHERLSGDVARLDQTGIKHVKIPHSTMRYSI